MRKFGLLLFSLIAVTFSACEPAATEPQATPAINKFAADSVLVTIADAQDRRKPEAVLPFLTHPDSTYRAAAAMAFGSLQDSTAVTALVALLNDPYLPAAQAAAYAIGQTRHASGAAPLLARLRNSPPRALVPMLGEALGKCGDSTYLASTVSGYDSNPEGDEAVAAILFQLALRKIVSEEAAALGLKLVLSPNPKAQTYAAAFLARARNLGPTADPQALITTYRALSNIDAKQHLTRAFSRCEDPACAAELLRIVEDPATDYRIKVNALMAMRNQPQADFIPAVQRLAVSENSHIAVTAVRYLLQHATPAHQLNFIGLAEQQPHWRPSAMLLGAGLKVHAMKNGNTADFKALQAATAAAYAASTNPYEKGALLVAMSQDLSQEAFLTSEMMRKEKVVSVYAMEALYQMYEKTSTPKNAKARLKNLQAAIESGDVAIMALAAGRIRLTEPLRKAVSDPSFLEEALDRLKLPAEIEIYNAIEATLAAIRGEDDPTPTPAPWSNPVDWDLVKQIPSDQECVFTLEQGEVRMKLRIEDAPGSVANFVKLGLQGFYDGAVLHRVVPNFVAQGGDPRGDGWGSGPETIRSEWPDLHYQEGSVGLASAGKDTESCQWFIAHCSTPHLDGRYTIFAEVVTGLDLVHKMQIGDRIVKASFPGLEIEL